MPSVKGTMVRTRRDFVLHKLGEEGWQRVLTRLEPEVRQHWELTVLASGWYPIDDVAALEEAIIAELALPAEAACTEIGSFSAEQSLPSTYRHYFPRNATEPIPFFEQLLTLYPVLYDFGRVWLDTPTESSVEIRHDFEGHATRSNCLVARAFFERAALLTGLESLRVREVACQANDADCCIMALSWGTSAPPSKQGSG